MITTQGIVRARTISPRASYRLGLGLAVATTLFLFLGSGALGIIGDGGRPDRIYATVLGVAVIGSAVALLRAKGMALAMAATALAQVTVTAAALLAGLHEPENASVVDIVMINAMYAALWSASAWLFHRAATGAED